MSSESNVAVVLKLDMSLVSPLCRPGGDISQLPQLLLSVCETVKDEALALIDNTRHIGQMGEVTEDEDSMETDSPRGPQKDQRDGVSGAAMLTRRVFVRRCCFSYTFNSLISFYS